MRTCFHAALVGLVVALASSAPAFAQDADKESKRLEEEREKLLKQREEEQERRLKEQREEAEKKQREVEKQEKELEKLRPRRIPSPYVDPPDLALGTLGSTFLTMQSPRPRTRVYLAGDMATWPHADGYPYRNRGWGMAGRAGGELALGRLSFGADMPWLYYQDAVDSRKGFGDLTVFSKLHIFGEGKYYEAKSYFTSLLRLTFPTHFPREKWDSDAGRLSGDGYPATDDFYTKIEMAALVGHTLFSRLSFGAQAGFLIFVGTGDLDGCPTQTGMGTPHSCRAENHFGFDGHAHVGLRLLEAFDLHALAGGVIASGLNFANGAYLGGSANVNLGSFRISLGAVFPLNDQLKRVSRFLTTLSVSWEHGKYRRPSGV